MIYTCADGPDDGCAETDRVASFSHGEKGVTPRGGRQIAEGSGRALPPWTGRTVRSARSSGGPFLPPLICEVLYPPSASRCIPRRRPEDAHAA